MSSTANDVAPILIKSKQFSTENNFFKQFLFTTITELRPLFYFFWSNLHKIAFHWFILSSSNSWTIKPCNTKKLSNNLLIIDLCFSYYVVRFKLDQNSKSLQHCYTLLLMSQWVHTIFWSIGHIFAFLQMIKHTWSEYNQNDQNKNNNETYIEIQISNKQSGNLTIRI